MSSINIDGESISYSISRNVFLNCANSHRLIAFCPCCGEQFTQCAVSDRVYKEKVLQKWITEDLKRHRENGYCKFHPVERITKPVVKTAIINNQPIKTALPRDLEWWERCSW